MRKSVVLALVVLVAGAAVAQNTPSITDHTPSPEQCEKDAAAWWGSDPIAHAAMFKSLAVEAGKMTIPQLNKRGREMAACGVQAVESADLPGMTRYSGAANFYLDIVSRRAMQFIRRHHLMNQMLAEDAAGER